MRSPVRPVLLAALLPLCALASAPAEDPILTQAQAAAQAARAHAASPRAIAYLAELHALRDELADLHLLAQTYTDLTFRRAPHPEVKRHARMLLAEVEASRGRLSRVSELQAPLGFLRGFHVVGAFDNEGKAGCDVDHGPEAKLDLAQVYPTRHGETGWRRLEARSRDGYVDLASALRPTREAVAYALTFLEAPAETRAELSVGTSGAFRLWVNGERVLLSNDYNDPRPDQARVSVRLRKGHNRVLLKVCQQTGPLGFFLRHEAVGPGPAAQAVLPPSLPPLERGLSAQPQALPTAAALLARQVEKAPSDARLRGDFAAVLHHTRAFDEGSRRDVVEAERAADASPGDVGLQLLAARLHAEDHNRRRHYVDRALAADGSHPLARLSLAHHHLERDRPGRALFVLEPLVKQWPRFSRAHLALAQAYAALDEWPRSVATVEDAFRLGPQVPSVAKEAARVARRLDRPGAAMERYRAVIGLRHDDVEARRSVSALLSDAGRTQEAARELSALSRLWPEDNSVRLRLAELAAANGELAQARKLFDEARSQCPDEPEVHEREGRALLQAGRKEEALAALERALALRPQNPSLREALRSLQGLDAAWGVQHALDVAPLAKEADGWATEDAVYLVDYTHVRVQPTGQSSRFHQVAVKVFTQRGVDAFRTFPITWSPARQEVAVLRVRITKPDGSVVESFGDQDRSINEPWSGMYYDARARELSFPALAPGDVLELRYRIEDSARDNLLSDYWGDVDHVQTVAPKLRYQYLVDMPASRPLYWNRQRLGTRVHGEESDAGEPGRRLYRFTAQKVPRIVPEPGMPGWAEVATTLHVSTYQTWDQVGRYWWGLVRDQLVPTDEVRRAVDAALGGVDRKDPRAVVQALYNFVVTHTRYVALEFGIHGFKPYRVDRVLARRFGDCKDKASLLYAMLKVAGVDSRLVLLRMRDLGAIGEEPASLAAFNHAILYVPSLDLYLDGTAAFHGAAELPTADRVANVLIVEPDGKSPFLTTPESAAADNATHLEMTVKVAVDGRASASGKTRVAGVQAPEYRRSYQSASSRRTLFEQGWGQAFPGLRVSRMDMAEPISLDHPVEVAFDLEVPRYAEVLPDGLRFFPFGSPRTYAQAYAALAQRSHDLVMSSPWSNTFAFRHVLPEGYTATELPAAVDEETPFGRLRLSHRVEDGVLLSDGEVSLTVARVAAADYPAFRAFLLRVDQALSRRVSARRGPQLPPAR
jgi:tetratricopeptide (TPR) repeat protein